MELHEQTPLAEAIAASGMSQLELAFKIGVDTTTIWRWAAGKSHPNSEATRRTIARVLGRHLDELFPPELREAA